MADAARLRPAFYAAHGGGVRQWWTVLHPPYTAWHLSYVVLGAALAPRVALAPLLAALGAFFLAVGIAAHALDELHGRPLRTTIPSRSLVVASAASLGGATLLGIFGVLHDGWVLVPLLVAGPLLVVAYNAELFGGVFHCDTGFSLAWGAFPVITAYVAEARSLSLAALVAAGAATALSFAQRHLSTSARTVRRQVVEISGTMRFADGSSAVIDEHTLLRPIERALRLLSWGVVLVAVAVLLARVS